MDEFCNKPELFQPSLMLWVRQGACLKVDHLTGASLGQAPGKTNTLTYFEIM
jgi:hypothetical protein